MEGFVQVRLRIGGFRYPPAWPSSDYSSCLPLSEWLHPIQLLPLQHEPLGCLCMFPFNGALPFHSGRP